MNGFKEKFLLTRIRLFRDEKAFAEIYQNYQSALRRYLALKLPTPEDADDAVATTFLRIWNYLLASEVESLSGLIFTIAKGVVAEFYRTREAKTVPIELGEQVVDEKAEIFRKTADALLIKDALTKLTDEAQQIVTMRFFEGLPISEIARRVGKADGATRMAIHRALKELKRHIAK